ncbi:MAG: hypothetical protein ACJ741_21485 [Pyrinomonadaceae bacterium]
MKIMNNSRRLLLCAVASLCFCAAAGNLSVARAQCGDSSLRSKVSQTNILTWESFRAPQQTGESALCYRLSDGDIITLRKEPRAVASDQIEFVLETPLNVTWWKGLTLAHQTYRSEGETRAIQSVFTENESHRSHSIIVRAYDQLAPTGYMLVFSKAKALGAHTEMYRLPVGDTRYLRGYRLTFTWDKDG